MCAAIAPVRIADIRLPYQPIGADDFPALPQVAAETVPCDAKACAIERLIVVPNTKPEASWHVPDPPHGPVKPAAPTRYHVPLGRPKLLVKYEIEIAIAGAEEADTLLLDFYAMSQLAAVESIDVDKIEAVTRVAFAADWKLPAEQAPFKLVATLVAKSGAATSAFLYVDDDAAVFGFELEFIRPQYLARAANGGYPSDELQYPLIRRDIQSWCAAMQAMKGERGFEVQWNPDDLSKGIPNDEDWIDQVTRVSFTVTYPAMGGWWFEVTHDSGCIEVNGAPLTPCRYRRVQAVAQRDIFESATALALAPAEMSIDYKNLGLSPEEDGAMIALLPDRTPHAVGAGHIHIGLRPAFSGDLLLLRNFMVSFLNFTTFGCGVFYRDFGNAPPFAMLFQRLAFTKFLEEWESRLVVRNATDEAIIDFLALFQSYFLQKTFVHPTYPKQQDFASFPEKYQALCLKSTIRDNDEDSGSESGPEEDEDSGSETDEANDLGGRKTIEIRSLRTQATFDQFCTLTEMFQAKIDALRTCAKPVPLDMDRAYVKDVAAYLSGRYKKKFTSWFNEGEGCAMPSEDYYDGNARKDEALEKMLDDACQTIGMKELEMFLGETGFPPDALQDIVRFAPPF